MSRSACARVVPPAALGLALFASACASAAPAAPAFLPDAELIRRFEAHRGEFEQLRDLALPCAAMKARRTSQQKARPTRTYLRDRDAIDDRWRRDPRVVRLEAAIGLDDVEVLEDSTLNFVIRSHEQRAKRNSARLDPRFPYEKGIGWSPHPSWASWNERANLDTLQPPRNLSMSSSTFHRRIDGGWFVFRDIENSRQR